MKILTQTLLFTFVLFLPCFAVRADSTTGFDVLKSMSVDDFRATGLDKLTSAQIHTLDAWISQYQRTHVTACAAVATTPSPADAATQKTGTAQTSANGTIIAHLVGTFRGWNGGTVFKLDNGQTWEQVDDSVLTVGGIRNPEVTINRGVFDSHYLSVEGVQDEVLVRRVKP